MDLAQLKLCVCVCVLAMLYVVMFERRMVPPQPCCKIWNSRVSPCLWQTKIRSHPNSRKAVDHFLDCGCIWEVKHDCHCGESQRKVNLSIYIQPKYRSNEFKSISINNWVSSHFCWPWRFPQQCSVAGIVWKRWHGSLWRAIFHEDLLCKLESGKANRKTIKWVIFSSRTEKEKDHSRTEFRIGGGQKGGRVSQFFTQWWHRRRNSRIIVILINLGEKESKIMGASARRSESNVHFTKTQSILQHTGGSECHNCSRNWTS